MSNIPLYLIISILIHGFIQGSSYSDAIQILGLCALYCYSQYVEANKRQSINDEVKQQLADMASELVMMKSAVNAVKLGTAFKK